MDRVRITYVGSSSRRVARGHTATYRFGRGGTQKIPASDIEKVTGNDPDNWKVEWPEVPQPEHIESVPTETAKTPRRYGGRGATATKTEPRRKTTLVNEE